MRLEGYGSFIVVTNNRAKFSTGVGHVREKSCGLFCKFPEIY